MNTIMHAADFKQLLVLWARIMEKNKEELIRLDGLCGDSDLGLTMSAGFLAASAAVCDSEETDIGKLSYAAGKAMSTAVPSTMGTLMASGFMAAGKALHHKDKMDAAAHKAFFEAFYQGVKFRGKANPGEKTFLDGLKPAVDSLDTALQAGVPLREAALAAAKAAQQGFEATRGMLAGHGRMAIHGEASREFLDPGAAVAALLMRVWADFVTGG